MSAQHTPGPWIAEHRRGADGMHRTEIFSDTHGVIATCSWTPKHCGNGVTQTYREANASLIAAAPDLLEALKGVVRVADRATAEFDAARAAIAKATGHEGGA